MCGWVGQVSCSRLKMNKRNRVAGTLSGQLRLNKVICKRNVKRHDACHIRLMTLEFRRLTHANHFKVWTTGEVKRIVLLCSSACISRIFYFKTLSAGF